MGGGSQSYEARSATLGTGLHQGAGGRHTGDEPPLPVATVPRIHSCSPISVLCPVFPYLPFLSLGCFLHLLVSFSFWSSPSSSLLFRIPFCPPFLLPRSLSKTFSSPVPTFLYFHFCCLSFLSPALPLTCVSVLCSPGSSLSSHLAGSPWPHSNPLKCFSTPATLLGLVLQAVAAAVPEVINSNSSFPEQARCFTERPSFHGQLSPNHCNRQLLSHESHP